MEQRRAFVSTKALRRLQARYLRAEDFEGYRSAEQPTALAGTPKNSKIDT